MDAIELEKRFEEISKRAEEFIADQGDVWEKMIDGLSMLEVAALTASIHASIDFRLFAAKRVKEREEEVAKHLKLLG